MTLQAAFAIIITPGDRNPLSFVLWLPSVLLVLHQICLVQLLKHTHTHTAHTTDDTVVLITLTEPLCALWTLWKRLQLHLRWSFCGACRGLFSFESGTGQWCTCVAISWITCAHTQFIVLIVMWWPPGEWSQRKFISTLSELYQLQQKRIFKTDLKQCIGWLYSFWI